MCRLLKFDLSSVYVLATKKSWSFAVTFRIIKITQNVSIIYINVLEVYIITFLGNTHFFRAVVCPIV